MAIMGQNLNRMQGLLKKNYKPEQGRMDAEHAARKKAIARHRRMNAGNRVGGFEDEHGIPR